jgi:predicted DsbA family dithiol-disulfide isomerase
MLRLIWVTRQSWTWTWRPLRECVSTRRYQDEVIADLEWAVNLGISSTPTFFINGIALVGAQPFDVFFDVITKELAGEIP